MSGKKTYPKSAGNPQTQPANRNNGGAVQTSVRQLIYNSPLPPPEILGQYESILPGAMDRIISMAESEANHRQPLETGALSAQITKDQRDSQEKQRGQRYALASVLAAFVVALLALLMGFRPWREPFAALRLSVSWPPSLPADKVRNKKLKSSERFFAQTGNHLSSLILRGNL